MLKNIETRVGIFVLIALGIFVYMGFQVSAFRFDRGKYVSYQLYFKDISGLSRKADVKIAGVKVGWVDKITLISNARMHAQVTVLILKSHPLHTDAHAVVRQEGLLGPRYIEVLPGDDHLAVLEPGSILQKPSVEPASIDELMVQFRTIATNVHDVTESIKNVIGGSEGQEQLRMFMTNMSLTAQRFAHFSEAIQKVVDGNQERVEDLMAIGTNIKQLTAALQSDVFPSFQTSIEKISQVFDRDFDRIANSLNATSTSITETANQAKEGLRSLSSVTEKIDEGKGLLGKIINEDETYNDLRVAVQGFKNYISKMERMQIVFDSHFESMHRVAENYRYEDSKGYFDIRLHPTEDHFYVIQFATSEKGTVKRRETIKTYFDHQLRPIDTKRLDLDDEDKLDHIFRKERTRIYRNSVRFGIQFGKIFNDIAIRLGLFEGSAGFGIDVDIPFNTSKFRWVTTFEAFDFTGQNRIGDRRPHLKWLNRMFIMRNIYFTFGADDFASKRNASAFVGGGLRFGDDDVKYLLSSLSGAGTSIVA